MSELYSRIVGPFLSHEGVAHDENPPGRGSGRYGWGTGKNPGQHQDTIPWSMAEVERLRKENLTPKEIADYYGISQNELRRRISVDNMARESEERARCIDLQENKHYSLRKIAQVTGLSTGTVRKRLSDYTQKKIDKNEGYMQTLRDEIDAKGHVDVGAGSEHSLGVSDVKMKQLVKSLAEEGYVLSHPKYTQAGTGYETGMIVLSKKGTPKNYIYNHMDEIQTLDDYNVVELEGLPKKKEFHDPVQISSSRVRVKYNEEGGVLKDGVVELRRGVPDLNLGKSNYAQVRIGVDGTHYIKGMAVYSDDLPEGVDVLFNTNKHQGTPMLGPDKNNSVFKPVKGEGLHAFEATIRDQNDWVDADGTKHQGPINIVKEQGVWHEQQRTLAAQFLSKQPYELAKKQLDIAYGDRLDEFKSIQALDNPVVKQKMLRSFADECDAAAVHLKAAAIPRQSWNVILPLTTLKPGEIYAPSFKQGEEVVCIRYPHAGKFELEQLKVNNKNKEGQKIIGVDGFDAVGILKSSAEKLSGADFDGDTVLVIPNPKRPTKNGKYTYDIHVRDSLEGLKDFDPHEEFKGYKGMKVLSKSQTQIKMGEITNLITDMGLAGAPDDELARAVRHSMVIIDANKHELDWKASYKVNGIKELQQKWQKGGGAGTLISRAKSPYYVTSRVVNQPYDIDEETGRKIWNEQKAKTYIDKNGVEKTIPARRFKSTRMYETDDANTLLSDPDHATVMERVYAKYANQCKELGNQARKELLYSSRNEKIEYSKEAAEEYAPEVKALKDKLLVAEKNAPRERAAQRLASQKVKMKADASALRGNEMTDGEKRKQLAKEIENARKVVGAKKQRVTFTDREWEAIQKGAIHKTTLIKLLNNADEADYKEKATPKNKRGLSSWKISRIEALLAQAADPNNHMNMDDIAEYTGVSKSTIAKIKAGTYKGG